MPGLRVHLPRALYDKWVKDFFCIFGAVSSGGGGGEEGMGVCGETGRSAQSRMEAARRLCGFRAISVQLCSLRSLRLKKSNRARKASVQRQQRGAETVQPPCCLSAPVNQVYNFALLLLLSTSQI